MSRSSQESEGFDFQQATYKGTYVEAVESARAGLSPKKGNVRKKRRRPREFAILSLYSILAVISNMVGKENEFGKEKDKLQRLRSE